MTTKASKLRPKNLNELRNIFSKTSYEESPIYLSLPVVNNIKEYCDLYGVSKEMVVESRMVVRGLTINIFYKRKPRY